MSILRQLTQLNDAIVIKVLTITTKFRPKLCKTIMLSMFSIQNDVNGSFESDGSLCIFILSGSKGNCI